MFNKLRSCLFQVHFFGRDDKHHLSFEEFSSFVNAIQREVLRAEFLEYSRGLDKVIEFFIIYRVTIQVVPNLPFTSNQYFCFSLA